MTMKKLSQLTSRRDWGFRSSGAALLLIIGIGVNNIQIGIRYKKILAKEKNGKNNVRASGIIVDVHHPCSMRRFGERALGSRFTRNLRASFPCGSSLCSGLTLWDKSNESTFSRAFNKVAVTTANHIASLRFSHLYRLLLIR